MFEGYFNALIFHAFLDMSRIFSLIFIFLLVSFSPIFAADDIYLIENLPANIAAKTPSAAKILAVAQVNREAFVILLSRLNIDEKVAIKVSDEEISDMIRAQYINDEQMAGNNYSAIFNITFAKDFVDHVLAKKLQPENYLNKNDSVAIKPFLLVPIKVEGINNNVWQGNNWHEIFTKIVGKNHEKFVVLENNLENISIVNGDSVNDLGYESIVTLLNGNNASSIYLIFFNFDRNNDRINVDLTSIGLVGKKKTRLNFSNISSIDKNNLNEIVAKKVLNYLAGIKVNDKAVSGPINLEVKIRNLSNYLMMKSKIENSGLVNQLAVKALSHNYALLKLNYIGNLDVVSSFAAKGIMAQHRGENNYLIPNN